MNSKGINEAFDRVVKVLDGSLADNSQIEQPYRTKGIIRTDEEGSIIFISVKGIEVDFDIEYSADKYKASESEAMLLEAGYEKKDNGHWIMPDFFSSVPWK